MTSVKYRTILNLRMLFIEKVNILMKPNSITIFCHMKMLDKRIICINV